MNQLQAVLVWSVVGCLLAGCDDIDRMQGRANEHAEGHTLEFSWSFGGLDCAAKPDVHGIQITIPGTILHNEGHYPCSQNGVQGVVLKNLFAGTYSYTVEAMDSEENVLYAGRGSVDISTDVYDTPVSVAVHVDLLPVFSDVNLSWTLELTKNSLSPLSCQGTGAAQVHVKIDGEEKGPFACRDGEVPANQPSLRSVRIPNVRLGKRSLEVSTEGSDGRLFRYIGTFTNHDRSQVEHVSLQPVPSH